MFVEEIVYFLNIEAHKRLDPLHGYNRTWVHQTRD